VCNRYSKTSNTFRQSIFRAPKNTTALSKPRFPPVKTQPVRQALKKIGIVCLNGEFSPINKPKTARDFAFSRFFIYLLLAMNEQIFSDFNFSSLDSSEFKEDSVREDLIMPMLKELGYSSQSANKIIRSKKVKHPFVTVGAKELPLTNFPDYLLEVNNKYAWVLDAKAPNEDIKTGKNVEQTYFYAIHPDIRVPIYALCNGREFIAFDIHGETLIYFALLEIEKHYVH
jgi:hypothetical protein